MSRDILLSLIDPDPDQPRKHFDAAALDELAQSMKADGLAVAILLRPVGERFVIVHGERRWRAAQLLDWQSIPADVRELTPEAAHWLALVENVQRADLSPIEEAQFYQARLAEGLTQSELGTRIGKSQQYVADRLSLLRLEPEVQSLITARAVSPSVGRRLATIDDAKMQVQLARSTSDERLSVKTVESRIYKEKRRAELAEQGRFTKWGAGDFSFARLLEVDPDMEYYRPGIERGEFEFVHFAMRVRIKDLTRSLTDQPAPYPRYSGVSFKYIEPDHNASFEEDLSPPLFAESEWEEFIDFDEETTIEDWITEYLPGQFVEYRRPHAGFYPLCEHTRAELCRDYNPAFGRILVETGEKNCPCDLGDPFFVRQGWGQWRLVEFNDGDGGREQRRVFQHDCVLYTLINEMRQTLDTDVFSAQNFNELTLWKVQPIQMGWHAIRRKTIPKEDAIAALEADLARLRQAEPLTEDVLNEQVLDRLQAHTHERLGSDWREGTCTYPRRSDGTVDTELFSALTKQAAKRWG